MGGKGTAAGIARSTDAWVVAGWKAVQEVRYCWAGDMVLTACSAVQAVHFQGKQYIVRGAAACPVIKDNWDVGSKEQFLTESQAALHATHHGML